MFKKHIASVLAAAFIAAPAFAGDHAHGDAAVAQAFIKEIQASQTAYSTQKGAKFFQELAKGQKPRATVVTCSDSRVHTNMLDSTPEGDLFMIRDIGNQITTATGSVQYGVNHLGSSLVLVIGHSSCGAIKAAALSDADKAGLEAPIQKELATIGKVTGDIEGVKLNVNNQVKLALELFGDKVKAGQLMIVGGVYDFSDDMKKGAGKLNVTNVNGETDAAKIGAALSAAPAASHGHHHH